MAQEPAAGEAGDGGEGRRGEAHHHVGQGHVADKQVDPGVKAGRPGQFLSNIPKVGFCSKRKQILLYNHISLALTETRK